MDQQIDRPWTAAMMEDFIQWFETDPRAEGFRHLKWDKEMEEARER